MRTALLLLLLAAPLAAQAPCNGGGPRLSCWATWQAGNPLRNHPMSHALGGVAFDLAARSPIFSDGIRRSPWGRLAVVGLGQAFWEGWQLKETPRYRWDYAALDWGTAVASAALFELVIGGFR